MISIAYLLYTYLRKYFYWFEKIHNMHAMQTGSFISEVPSRYTYGSSSICATQLQVWYSSVAVTSTQEAQSHGTQLCISPCTAHHCFNSWSSGVGCSLSLQRGHHPVETSWPWQHWEGGEKLIIGSFSFMNDFGTAVIVLCVYIHVIILCVGCIMPPTCVYLVRISVLYLLSAGPVYPPHCLAKRLTRRRQLWCKHSWWS